MTSRTLHLFEGYGVELEYMIVNRETLSVKSVADELLKSVAGEYVSDVDRGDISWSNELVTHVIELKTNGPAAELENLAAKFQGNIQDVNNRLRPLGAQLMPGAAHPWMHPDSETRLWQHEYNEVYETYNRIFDCRGHGWANLQSTHVNLPFGTDEEFGRLHAAIRLLLPILPALAASSPIIEEKATGLLDTRLDYYRRNQRKVPSIAGDVIPEPVFSRADYEREIFQRTWRDIAPLDTEGVLQGEEFLNSRGAIARFSRGAIEIRVLDIQECPAADLAIVRIIVAVLKALVSEELATYEEQKKWAVAPLKDIFSACIENAGESVIENAKYLEFLGHTAGKCEARDLWRGLAERHAPELLARNSPLDVILRHGTLARRILRAADNDLSRGHLFDIYTELCDCLEEGRVFLP